MRHLWLATYLLYPRHSLSVRLLLFKMHGQNSIAFDFLSGLLHSNILQLNISNCTETKIDSRDLCAFICEPQIYTHKNEKPMKTKRMLLKYTYAPYRHKEKQWNDLMVEKAYPHVIWNARLKTTWVSVL